MRPAWATYRKKEGRDGRGKRKKEKKQAKWGGNTGPKMY